VARYKDYSYNQSKLIPVYFNDQLLPGTFEYALNHIVDKELDLSIFLDSLSRALRDLLNALELSKLSKDGAMADTPSFGRDRRDTSQDALYLDGTTDATSRMEIASVFSSLQKTGASWSLWVRPEVVRNQGILAYEFSGLFAADAEQAAAKLWMYSGGGFAGQGHLSNPIFGPALLNDTTQWVHLVGVVSDEDNVPGAEKFSLYANGDLVRGVTESFCCLTFGSEAWKFGVDTNGSPFDIPDGLVTSRFQGYLDDVRIFGRALSAEEVRVLYRE